MVELVLSTVGEYRLVEVIPPPNFAPVFGYWILEKTTTGTTTAVTAVHSHGVGHTPIFRHEYDDDGYLQWWVGNSPGPDIPLTGGTGLPVMLLASGTMLLAAGVGMIALFALKRKGWAMAGDGSGGKASYFTKLNR